VQTATKSNSQPNPNPNPNPSCTQQQIFYTQHVNCDGKMVMFTGEVHRSSSKGQ